MTYSNSQKKACTKAYLDPGMCQKGVKKEVLVLIIYGSHVLHVVSLMDFKTAWSFPLPPSAIVNHKSNQIYFYKTFHSKNSLN